MTHEYEESVFGDEFLSFPLKHLEVLVDLRPSVDVLFWLLIVHIIFIGLFGYYLCLLWLSNIQLLFLGFFNLNILLKFVRQLLDVFRGFLSG
jgi:hypothetical protein